MTSASPRRLPEHGQLAEINPASDTGQRWRRGQHSFVQRSQGGFDSDRYEVTPISDPVAKSYVERMHYSGSYVAASRRYGMFIHTGNGPDLVGVAVFAIPAQAKALSNVFPELRPSLNRTKRSTHLYRSIAELPVWRRLLLLCDPLDGIDRVTLRRVLVCERRRATGPGYIRAVRVPAAGWPAETVRVEVAAGVAYWSLLAGPLLSPVEPVDHFLRHLRFGRNAAESTTKSYAGHLKRFEQWRVAAGMTWEQAARDIARYLIHLRTTLRTDPGRGQGRTPC